MTDKFEHGGHLIAIEDEYKKKFLDFSANINPLGLSSKVKEELLNNIHNIINYPDSSCKKIKEKIASYYDLDSNQLIIGNGAVELIYLFCRVLNPKNALIISPAFSEYERALKGIDCKINYVNLLPQNDFNEDLQKIIINMKGNDVIFLGNPNNPTGNIYNLQSLRLIIEHAEANGCFVAIDESFMDFVDQNELYSANNLLKESHNLIIFHSLTKFFALPGLRIGFAVCNDEEVYQRINLIKDPWNVNSLAQIAGVIALSDEKYIKKTRNYIKSEKEYFYDELSEIKGLKVYKPTVNFILLNARACNITAKEIYEKLLKENIIIRKCDNYIGLDEYYFRLSVKKREENDLLVEKIEKILKQKKDA